MTTTAPSMAETLGKAHMAFLEDMRKLEDAARSTNAGSLGELQSHLAATQLHLKEHFRFEEENGYLDTVRKREPRLERSIEHLAEEHRDLSRSLDALVMKASTCTSLEEEMRGCVREWIKRVKNHEIRENELVQDAFNLDLGAED